MTDFIFLCSRISVDSDCTIKLKDPCSLEEKLGQFQHIKKERHHFADKGSYSESCGFSSSHVSM